MTVDEYLKCRQAFKDRTVQRDPEVERKACEVHYAYLAEKFTDQFIEQGMSPKAAALKAAEKAASVIHFYFGQAWLRVWKAIGAGQPFPPLLKILLCTEQIRLRGEGGSRPILLK